MIKKKKFKIPQTRIDAALSGGKSARVSGLDTSSNPFDLRTKESSVLRGWWLAGWHDAGENSC